MARNEVVLVDTSSWIEALRADGSRVIRDRVRGLLIDGRAAWCDMVAVELWNGARGEYEKKKLAELEREIIRLPTPQDVWNFARRLARRCRESGKTVPSPDLVIASCALFHEVDIDHCDEHLDVIVDVYKRKH